MSQRALVTALAVAVIILGVAVWFRQTSQPQQQAQAPAAETPGADVSQMPETALEPGVAWTAPRRWTTAGERPMRLATYAIPAAGDDKEPAECAVFYFGPNQGGGVEDNISRWIGQFENPGPAKRSRSQINGLEVTRVEVDGTFLAPGPNMEPTGQKQDFRLLGAIVAGPNGPVFFKLTGPVKTVTQAGREFDAMLASMRKS